MCATDTGKTNNNNAYYYLNLKWKQMLICSHVLEFYVVMWCGTSFCILLLLFVNE